MSENGNANDEFNFNFAFLDIGLGEGVIRTTPLDYELISHIYNFDIVLQQSANTSQQLFLINHADSFWYYGAEYAWWTQLPNNVCITIPQAQLTPVLHICSKTIYWVYHYYFVNIYKDN